MRLTVCVLASCLLAAPASAGVVAHIDNARQRMTVMVDGAALYSWPVSTARRGDQTPAGSYYVQRMERMWHSRKYHGAPMPHALFFAGGIAIHATSAVGQLGLRPATGPRRLQPEERPRTLFQPSASTAARRSWSPTAPRPPTPAWACSDAGPLPRLGVFCPAPRHRDRRRRLPSATPGVLDAGRMACARAADRRSAARVGICRRFSSSSTC